MSPIIASLALLGVLVGCRRTETARAASEVESRGVGRSDAQKTNVKTQEVDKEESPGSSVNILIDPRVEGPEQHLVLTFCFEDEPSLDPQIHHIRLARVDEKSGAIEITAKGDSWLWKEWVVGSVPNGFKSVEKAATPPGVYEAYVDAFVGDGVRRISIGDNHVVHVLPWDQFDTKPPKHCPPNNRQTANIVRPHDTGQKRPPRKPPG
jgi:hypothetical protein